MGTMATYKPNKKVWKELDGRLTKAKVAGHRSVATEWTTGDVPFWIPTGLTSLNAMLGGGLPVGKMIELSSVHESEGKTTLAILLAVEAQKLGGMIFWIESESALDKARAELLGLDLTRTHIIGAETAEDGFVYIGEVIEWARELPELPILFIWDTVAMAPTRDEKAGDDYGQGMAKKPRVMASGFRKILMDLVGVKATLLILNQTITDIGQMYGPKHTTPGGKALKFDAAIRLELRASKIRDPKVTASVLGLNVRLISIKNKWAPPFRSIQCPLFFTHGWDEDYALYNLLDEQKIITTAGAYKVYGDHKFHYGKLRDFLAANPEIRAEWQKRCYEVFPLPFGRRFDDRGIVVPMSLEERHAALAPKEDGGSGGRVKTT